MIDNPIIELFNSFLQFKYVVITGLIAAASIYYLTKRTGTDSILLVSGSLLHFISSIAYVILYRISWSGKITTEQSSVLYEIADWVNFFGGILFAAGFCILIYNLTQRQKNHSR